MTPAKAGTSSTSWTAISFARWPRGSKRKILSFRADMVAALLLGVGVLRLIAHKSPLDQAASSDITRLFDRAVQALSVISPEEGAVPPPLT
ncbi:MAG: hypothetical protein J2P29_00230 [Actinobacteria bacterium]|nr:hypothetical protein [Actinomycetota bacterium]